MDVSILGTDGLEDFTVSPNVILLRIRLPLGRRSRFNADDVSIETGQPTYGVDRRETE